MLYVFLFAAGSVNAIEWKDSFDDNKLNERWQPFAWSMEESPDWKIEDGILKANWPYWNGQMLFLKDFESSDFIMQVRCRIDKVWQVPELASAGMIFRSPGPGKSSEDNIVPLYGFGIGDSGSRIGIFPADSGWHFLETSFKKHEIGEWYTMRIVVKGTSFSCYVDDEIVGRMYNAYFDGKFVGLSIGSNISASFDDFMITDQLDEKPASDSK